MYCGRLVDRQIYTEMCTLSIYFICNLFLFLALTSMNKTLRKILVIVTVMVR